MTKLEATQAYSDKLGLRLHVTVNKPLLVHGYVSNGHGVLWEGEISPQPDLLHYLYCYEIAQAITYARLR